MKKKVKELEKNGVFHSQWSALMSQTRSKIGLAIVLLFVAAAVFAPLIAPNDPLLVDVSHKLEGPSSTYWLGTDQLGRCIASRLLWGGRNSLLYGAIVLVITLLVGVPIGLISGYVGGKTDLFFMRVIDIFMAMPSFIVALAIAGTLGASGKNLVLSMSFVYWAGYARLSRALTIQVKEQNYMMALKAGGCGHTRIIFRHVLRNIAPSIIALATMEIGTIILAIAGFSFIGLGVQSPMPSLGSLADAARAGIQSYPYKLIFPAMMICLIVLAFNLLGDGLRDAFDPKLRR